MAIKQNIDIIIGIIAWLLAISASVNFLFLDYALYGWDTHKKYLPITWVVLVVLASLLKKRPIKKLWWVLLGRPFTFITEFTAFTLLLMMAICRGLGC